jgi:F-type H+-transporting ATPase subunit b
MKTTAILISALLPGLAFAAGGGGHHDPGHTTPEQWRLMGFMFVNFALFVGLMIRFARAPLRDYLIQRRQDLVEAMNAAARAKEEAEALKREYEQKLAGLEQTRKEISEEIARIAESERERTLAQAREAAARLKTDAELTARSDFERAKRELRDEAARLATEIASKEIRSRLDEGERRRLVREFLSSVESGSGTEAKQ